MHFRALEDGDRDWLRALVDDAWGLPVVSISGLHDPAELDGFVAVDAQSLVGAVTYRIAAGGCEVVTLNALRRGEGIGAALLTAVKQLADAGGLRLWLITTDDNPGAIAFYERQGMRQVAVHRDFVEEVLRHKPWLAETGNRPFSDALEYSF